MVFLLSVSNFSPGFPSNYLFRVFWEMPTEFTRFLFLLFWTLFNSMSMLCCSQQSVDWLKNVSPNILTGPHQQLRTVGRNTKNSANRRRSTSNVSKQKQNENKKLLKQNRNSFCSMRRNTRAKSENTLLSHTHSRTQ